jgi:PGF-CTERM protein
MKTGEYILFISLVLLIPAMFATHVEAAPSVGNVTRSLSETTVVAGATIIVTITPSSNLPVSPVWGIEETVPSGFARVNTTAFTNSTTAAGTQRFSQVGSNAFTYTLVAPTVPGTYTISGTFVDADTNSGTIAPTTITVGTGNVPRSLQPTVTSGFSTPTIITPAAITPMVTPVMTAQAMTTPAVIETTKPTTPTATTHAKEPGFEAVLAIAGLLAVAFLVMRPRK